MLNKKETADGTGKVLGVMDFRSNTDSHQPTQREQQIEAL